MASGFGSLAFGLIVLFVELSGSEARASEAAALTRTRIAELVRAAPSSRVATAEAGVARAALGAAGAWSLENPTLTGMGGLRLNPDGSRPFSGSVSVAFPVPLGGQRDARVDAAKADVRGADANAVEAQRKTLLAALLQHALVLRHDRNLDLLGVRRAIAERLLLAAQKQKKAGAVAELDVALASLQVGRDAAAESAARGAGDADRQGLAALLGIEGAPLRARGPLIPEGELPPLDTLLHELGARAEVRSATASLDAARARSARERAARWPTFSVVAQVERDDGANIGLLGVAVPIPILNANRAAVATSAAEVDVASARLDAARGTAGSRVRELYARYLGTKLALEALQPTTKLAAEAVHLATRGYELGENDLGKTLLVRREVVEAETALLDAEHAHANAKLELLVTSGRVPR